MTTFARRERMRDRAQMIDQANPPEPPSWLHAAPNRPVVFQEPYPHKARTHSSTAQAFRENSYTNPLDCPAPWSIWKRRVSLAAPYVLSLALFVAMLTSGMWWK